MGKKQLFTSERMLQTFSTDLPSAANSFGKVLRQQVQTLDPFVLREVYFSFLRELQQGTAGEKTSLPFIEHRLQQANLVTDSRAFQIMVIGGSVFKQANVRASYGKIELLEIAEEALPLFKTKDDFLLFIEQHLRRDIPVLAINFAYPLSPVLTGKKLDGVLVRPMKEHAFAGLVGLQIGQTIEQYFQERYGREITVAVANDTVCLLLSGLTRYSTEEIAGGIVGTGTNFALFLDKGRMVNLESGQFTGFPVSQEAAVVDISSSCPGSALFEKEVAGGYLYHHFNMLLQHYALPYPPAQSTWEVKKLVGKRIPFVSDLASVLIEKSAALVATQIAAITTFLGKREFTFVMEGSFFWDGALYRDWVEEYLQLLVPHSVVSFVQIEQSPYLGAAKLVA